MRGKTLQCRDRCGLVDTGDRAEPTYRPLRRAQKILRRLRGSGSLTEPFPPQPKGMHFDIYDSLRHRVNNHPRVFDQALAAGEGGGGAGKGVEEPGAG